MRKDRVTHGIIRIMQAIADKEFELEQAIPGEAKLAEFLEVSRPTVREVVLLRYKFLLVICCTWSAQAQHKLRSAFQTVDPSVPCGSDFVGR